MDYTTLNSQLQYNYNCIVAGYLYKED